jgi:hypothetical protein
VSPDDARAEGGTYECRYCGTVLDVPAGHELKVTICARSGRCNERIVTIDDVEIHHCGLDESPNARRPT